MKSMRHIVAALLTLGAVTSACGGGGGTYPSAATPSAAPTVRSAPSGTPHASGAPGVDYYGY